MGAQRVFVQALQKLARGVGSRAVDIARSSLHRLKPKRIERACVLETSSERRISALYPSTSTSAHSSFDRRAAPSSDPPARRPRARCVDRRRRALEKSAASRREVSPPSPRGALRRRAATARPRGRCVGSPARPRRRTSRSGRLRLLAGHRGRCCPPRPT